MIGMDAMTLDLDSPIFVLATSPAAAGPLPLPALPPAAAAAASPRSSPPPAPQRRVVLSMGHWSGTC